MIPKPLSDRVILRPVVQPERTSGGLIIPEVAKERPQEGEVIAVGPGKPPLVPEVREGDRVLYGKYTGTEITVENQTYLILRESDILAILP